MDNKDKNFVNTGTNSGTIVKGGVNISPFDPAERIRVSGIWGTSMESLRGRQQSEHQDHPVNTSASNSSE